MKKKFQAMLAPETHTEGRNVDAGALSGGGRKEGEKERPTHTAAKVRTKQSKRASPGFLQMKGAKGEHASYRRRIMGRGKKKRGRGGCDLGG